MNWQVLKDRPGMVLIVGSMVVGAPRYVDAFANSAGFRLNHPAWDLVHAASGLGMALLEALAIWFTSAMLSRHGRKDLVSSLLAILIVVTLLALAVIVTPVIRATASHALVVNLLDESTMWVWSAALMLAPLLVIASSAIAEHLASSSQESAMSHLRLEPTPSVAGSAAQSVNVDIQVDARRLTVGASTSARILERVKREPDVSQAALARELGISRQAVSQHLKQLAAAGLWPDATGVGAELLMSDGHQRSS